MYKQLYITREDFGTLSFPYGWQQTFDHPFEMSFAANEAQVVKDFVADTQNRQAGLEILILLYDFTFATRAQLERLLAVKGLHIDADTLDALLSKYLRGHLINRFTLSVYPMDHIPDDAFDIYCLDHGARHILSHFYHDDIAVTFKSTNALRSAELVSKYLATNEFYLSLLTGKTEELSSFAPACNFSIRRRDIRLSATFRIMNGFTPCDFLLEVIRKSDIPVMWRKKSGEQLAPFLIDGAWKRYFHIEPRVILLAEDMEQAEDAAEIFALRTEGMPFFITTDKELAKGILDAEFYAYAPDEKCFCPAYPF